MPFSFPELVVVVVVVAPVAISGGDRLRSHSFIKSAAVRLMLLGVRPFRTGGKSSSSFFDGLGGDAERAVAKTAGSLDIFFLLFWMGRRMSEGKELRTHTVVGGLEREGWVGWVGGCRTG